MTLEEFEQLRPEKKEEAIETANLNKVWYGFCQGCGVKIEAVLKDFPKQCPSCGYGSRRSK